MTGRIDVHAHFVPGFYRQALIDAGQDHPDGIRAIPDWSETAHLELMDRLNIATAMLSISSPGVHFGDAGQAVALARRCNEEGARLSAGPGGRFGHFACLPVPEIGASVAEARRALDELGADGIVLQTNHRGVYLGNPVLAPLFDELNERGTVIFLHPTSPRCAAEHLSLGYPRPMLEFMFDTTRSVTDLILSGAAERYPNLTFIVPHAGAALPVLANRIELLLPLLTPPGAPSKPSVRQALRRLHFDLAGAPVQELLGALGGVADPRHLHYGSDYPFTPAEPAVRLAGILDNTDDISAPARQALMSENSLALFPRLSSRSRN